MGRLRLRLLGLLCSLDLLFSLGSFTEGFSFSLSPLASGEVSFVAKVLCQGPPTTAAHGLPYSPPAGQKPPAAPPRPCPGRCYLSGAGAPLRLTSSTRGKEGTHRSTGPREARASSLTKSQSCGVRNHSSLSSLKTVAFTHIVLNHIVLYYIIIYCIITYTNILYYIS